MDGGAAEDAGFKPGDIIVGYADRGAPDRQRLHELSEEFADKKTRIQVERDGERLDRMWIKPKKKGKTALIGILPGVDMANLVVAGVRVHPAVMASFSPPRRLAALARRLAEIDPDLADYEAEELMLYGGVERRLRERRL